MKGLDMSENRDIVKEAQMIIDSYANRIPCRKNRTSRKKKSSEKTLWFFAGIATSTALLLSIFLKIY